MRCCSCYDSNKSIKMNTITNNKLFPPLVLPLLSLLPHIISLWNVYMYVLKYWNVICCSTLCQMAFKSAKFPGETSQLLGAASAKPKRARWGGENEVGSINQGLSIRYVNTTTITICACSYFILYLLHPTKTVIYIHTYIHRPLKLLDS